jgi:hypothetical protein
VLLLLALALTPRAARAGLFGGGKQAAAVGAQDEENFKLWLMERGAVVRLGEGGPPGGRPRQVATDGARFEASLPEGRCTAGPLEPQLNPLPPPALQLNAEARARPGDRSGDRGVFATTDIPEGGLIARIPMAASMWCVSGGAQRLEGQRWFGGQG